MRSSCGILLETLTNRYTLHVSQEAAIVFPPIVVNTPLSITHDPELAKQMAIPTVSDIPAV